MARTAGQAHALLAVLLLLCAGALATARDLRRVVAPTTYKKQLLKAYLSNDELPLWMDEFIARCPGMAQKFSIGKSVNGVDLWVLEVAEAPGQDDGKPNFKYSANMHGDETVGRMMLPMLAEWLCANKATDPRAAKLLSDIHLFLIPTMNPDGFALMQRFNANNEDLNRNFPDQFKDGRANMLNPAGRQPETQAMMAFSLTRAWLGAANFHGGDVVVNYPWDAYDATTYLSTGADSVSPDDATYKWWAKTYASKNPAMAGSKSFKDGITNGANWYPIWGGLQDWDYINAGCMHMTIEVSTVKNPPKTQLSLFWRQNQNSLLELPLAALRGVRGNITAKDTGAPLAATVHIKSTGDFTTFKSGPHGGYARPAVPGSGYTLVAELTGYQTAEVPFTVPADGSGAVVNVALATAR